MHKYEHLENEACEDGIDVIHYDFESPQIKGLYMDHTIALSRQLKTQAEKHCILAEEMGHHYTSSGNILDQKKVTNRKQEHKAEGGEVADKGKGSLLECSRTLHHQAAGQHPFLQAQSPASRDMVS